MIMKFHTFESMTFKQYRTVDLAQLYYDVFRFRKELGFEHIELITDIWENEINPDLLEDKEVLILKDDFFGRIKKVGVGEDLDTYIKFYFYDSDRIIKLNIGLMGPKKTALIRIYNSKETEIEEKINLLKETGKFNL